MNPAGRAACAAPLAIWPDISLQRALCCPPPSPPARTPATCAPHSQPTLCPPAKPPTRMPQRCTSCTSLSRSTPPWPPHRNSLGNALSPGSSVVAGLKRGDDSTSGGPNGDVPTALSIHGSIHGPDVLHLQRQGGGGAVLVVGVCRVQGLTTCTHKGNGQRGRGPPPQQPRQGAHLAAAEGARGAAGAQAGCALPAHLHVHAGQDAPQRVGAPVARDDRKADDALARRRCRHGRGASRLRCGGGLRLCCARGGGRLQGRSVECQLPQPPGSPLVRARAAAALQAHLRGCGARLGDRRRV